MNKLGEYPIAAKFPSLQSAFSILFYGANKRGSLIIDLFKADGTIISSVTILKITNGPYYFINPTAEIAGFSIWNTDVGGLGIAKIGYLESSGLVLSAEFNTEGSIVNPSLPLDLSPNNDWYYTHDSINAIATGGIVTPARFDMYGVSELTISSLEFKGTLATGTGESLQIYFNTWAGGFFYVRIKEGTNLSRVSYNPTGSNPIIAQDFTACLSAPETMTITTTIEENVIKVYKHPDLQTPIATLNETITSPITPTIERIVNGFAGQITTVYSSLDYIRAYLK